MGIREAVVIGLVVGVFGGLFWMLKKPQTKTKFYIALALVALGALTMIMGFLDREASGFKEGFKICAFWGGVCVLTSTTKTWQRVAGWCLVVFGFLLYAAKG
jgi:small basic protein